MSDAVANRPVLAVLALGLAGAITDLLLLRHYESGIQILPIALAGIALASTGWHAFSPSPTSRQAFLPLMGLLFVTGLVGVILHYQGNREFQMEADATQHGWALFLKIIRAKAPPALAPASLCLLGLLGFVSAKGNKTSPA